MIVNKVSLRYDIYCAKKTAGPYRETGRLPEYKASAILQRKGLSSYLEDGENMTKIAEKYGIHRNTLRKYLAEMQKNEKS